MLLQSIHVEIFEEISCWCTSVGRANSCFWLCKLCQVSRFLLLLLFFFIFSSRQSPLLSLLHLFRWDRGVVRDIFGPSHFCWSISHALCPARGSVEWKEVLTPRNHGIMYSMHGIAQRLKRKCQMGWMIVAMCMHIKQAEGRDSLTTGSNYHTSFCTLWCTHLFWGSFVHVVLLCKLLSTW